MVCNDAVVPEVFVYAANWRSCDGRAATKDTDNEGNGQASDAVSYSPPEGNSNANMARRNAMLPAARARP
jgi:hypothetical protein